MKRTVLVLAALTLPAFADQRGDTPGTQPSTPQEQLAKFHVPPGFEVQLVAAEPEIQKPINLNFDAAGRLWATGSELYPWPARTDANGEPIADFDRGFQGIVDSFKVGDKAPQPSPVGKDTVRILSDFGPDGHARKITLFADRLSIPGGIQPLPRKPGGWSPQIAQIDADGQKAAPSSSDLRKSAKSADNPSAEIRGDSAIVYSIPNIWLISDPDGDGFAQKREPLYTGFGYTDTHGGASSFIYWIDGWIYGTHGFKNHSEVRDRNGKVTVVDSGNTYRFRPDGSAFEIYAHGQTNPFGLAFDPLGNLYSADSHSKPVYLLLRGGYYEGIGKQHDGLGFAPRITDDDHGSSAIAGITYYADDKWPEEYRGNLFNGNPVTQRINRDRLEWHGSTPRAIRMPDFLTCDDPWFRPVNLKLGPDGALYIADFYNPIIGHYEVPLTHPARDHAHGRIWRVVYRGGREMGSGVTKSTSPATGQTSMPTQITPHSTFGTPNRDVNHVELDVPKVDTDQKHVDGVVKHVVHDANLVDSDPKKVARVDENDTAHRNNGARDPLPSPPDLTKLDASGLIEKLADPSLEVRRLATNELVDRVGKDAYSLLQGIELRRRDPAIITTLQDWSIWLTAKGTQVESDTDETPWAAVRVAREAGMASYTMIALERLGRLDPQAPIDLARDSDFFVELQATRLLAERPEWKSEYFSAAEERAFADDNSVSRAAMDALARHPRSASLDPLLRAWASRQNREPQLTYATRIVLREVLSSPKGFEEIAHLSIDAADARELLAEVSLAVKTPEAATFLLAHLERTKFETPRTGEYLKHALLYLASEKLDAAAKLFAGMRQNQPLPTKLALATALAETARQRRDAVPESMLQWSRGVLLETLASNNDGLIKPAIAAVRDLKLEAKLAPLAKIARDEFRDDALRAAALEAAANLPASHDLLAAAFADPRHMNLRKRAAELLAQNGDAATVLAALPQAPWELAVAISGALAKTDPGATALLDAIEAGQAPARVLVNKAVVGPFFARPKALQDRAKTLAKDVPPEDARLNLLIAQRAVDFRDAPRQVGALEKGTQIFQQQCAVCHRFRNAGGNVGPNLDGVAARGPQRLIEDILDPNRNIDPGFRQTVIETRDGQTLIGANPREQADALTLTDATGKELNLPKATIKTRTTLNLSLMPPAFESTIPPGDFNNLLVYLLAPAK